jgi:hypothetical protein
MFRRWLIRGIFLTLLTLCLTAWATSYFRGIAIYHEGKSFHCLAIGNGRIGLLHSLSRTTSRPRLYTVTSTNIADFWGELDPSIPPRWGFSYLRAPDLLYLCAPFWSLFVPFALLTGLAWRLTRRRPTIHAFPVEPARPAPAHPNPPT